MWREGLSGRTQTRFAAVIRKESDDCEGGDARGDQRRERMIHAHNTFMASVDAGSMSSRVPSMSHKHARTGAPDACAADVAAMITPWGVGPLACAGQRRSQGDDSGRRRLGAAKSCTGKAR